MPTYSYAELLSLYNKAISQLREQQDLSDKRSKMWNEYEERCEITIKHARKLCETILAKDRKSMKLGTSKSWHSISSDELIQMALESFNEYVRDRTQLLNDIMNISEERERTIENLTEQLELSLKQGGSYSNVSAAMAAAKKEQDTKEAVDKSSYQIKEAVSSGKVEVIIDDVDDMDEQELRDVQELINTGKQVSLTHNSIPIGKSKKKIEQLKKAEDEVIAHLVDLQDNLSQCDENEWSIFEAIGKKGLSRYQDIEAYIVQNSSGLKTAIRQAALKLVNMNALQKEIFKLPISSKCVFYRLTDIGRRMYKHHYEEDAVVSEIERIVAEHDNAEHGYGILETQSVLESSGRYTEISSFNRSNAISVTINGQPLKYIPDLLCKSKKGYTEYIEYERGTHNQASFNLKLNKMCRVTKYINIVVPNKNILKETKAKVDNWIKTKEATSLKGYHLLIGTVRALKDDVGYQVEYQFSKSLDPVKDPF